MSHRRPRLGLPARHLEPPPATRCAPLPGPRQSSDAPVAVPAEARGQPHSSRPQGAATVDRHAGEVAPGDPGLTHHPTGPTPRNLHHPLRLCDGPPPRCRAQKCRAQKFPSTASRRIWLATVRSATARRSRAFSPSDRLGPLRLGDLHAAASP